MILCFCCGVNENFTPLGYNAELTGGQLVQSTRARLLEPLKLD
jgi:hypothetical protein